jgi:hypothetical protein
MAENELSAPSPPTMWFYPLLSKITLINNPIQTSRRQKAKMTKPMFSKENGFFIILSNEKNHDIPFE